MYRRISGACVARQQLRVNRKEVYHVSYKCMVYCIEYTVLYRLLYYTSFSMDVQECRLKIT